MTAFAADCESCARRKAHGQCSIFKKLGIVPPWLLARCQAFGPKGLKRIGPEIPPHAYDQQGKIRHAWLLGEVTP